MVLDELSNEQEHAELRGKPNGKREGRTSCLLEVHLDGVLPVRELPLPPPQPFDRCSFFIIP